MGGRGTGVRSGSGLLPVEDESGKGGIGNGVVVHPLLPDESEELEGDGSVTAQELLAVAGTVRQ